MLQQPYILRIECFDVEISRELSFCILSNFFEILLRSISKKLWGDINIMLQH
jgi:hypothetical protein